MTYAVMAPEHPLVDAADHRRRSADAVDELRRRAAAETDIERMAEGDPATLDKRGAFTGSYVINPFTGEPGPALRGRLRPHGLRHRGDHGGAGRGRARLGLRHACTDLPIVRTVQPPEDWEAERRRGLHR